MNMEMTILDRKNRYQKLALERLSRWAPFTAEELMTYAASHDAFQYEEIDGYHYCLFSWPEIGADGQECTDPEEENILMERLVLLVYDELDRIVTDISGLHGSMQNYLCSPQLFNYLCDDNDWAYLEHYTLVGFFFPELNYPPCEMEALPELPEDSGEVLHFTNAYVTRAFRGRGFFRNMVDMMKEFALRQRSAGETVLYQVFALDPDIACYGPDTVSTPYIYSFEKDEPDRLRNAEILKHMGFEPVRLEEIEEQPDSDGTKLWFAIKRETVFLVEGDYVV